MSSLRQHMYVAVVGTEECVNSTCMRLGSYTCDHVYGEEVTWCVRVLWYEFMCVIV